MRRESLAGALAVDDELVTGVAQPVKGAAREDRVVEQAEPLFGVAVGGDCEARRAETGGDQFVEFDRLLMVEPVQTEVVQGGLRDRARGRRRRPCPRSGRCGPPPSRESSDRAERSAPGESQSRRRITLSGFGCGMWWRRRYRRGPHLSELVMAPATT